MKNEIVTANSKGIFINSVKIATMLDVPHRDLLRTIEKIVLRIKNNAQCGALKFPPIYKESNFLNKMGRTYKMYDMNEQAYMKLAMHLKGYEEAERVQDAIIEAFSLMKNALLNHENASWLDSRRMGKLIRRNETDTIKEFVEYATKQGSKSAFRYYSNITKMTNKALELLVQTDYGEKLRDLADIQALGFIQLLENRAAQAIRYGIDEGLPYKHIYKYAKTEVNNLADSLNFKKQIPDNLNK